MRVFVAWWLCACAVDSPLTVGPTPPWTDAASILRFRDANHALTSDAPTPVAFTVVAKNVDYALLSVDPLGTVYATRLGAPQNRLWASTDGGLVFTQRGTHPTGASFKRMAALPDGTLLADVDVGGAHGLARSVDRGFTWRDVLALGAYRMLQPHSIAWLENTVYFAEYQSFANASTLCRLWASTDGGQSWSERHVFTTYRHAHALLADPQRAALWALMGSSHGGLLRSTDRGFTWTQVVESLDGVAVDAVVTDTGLLYGLDALFRPARPGVVRLGRDDVPMYVAPLPGPSYSMMRLPSVGYLLGITREPLGDVYAPTDESAHVFFSPDGEHWEELFGFPRLHADEYARADVYHRLPSPYGDVFVEVSNVVDFGQRGQGFLRLAPRPNPEPPEPEDKM